ncbi:MAG TPA: GAF domain-containing protein [Candidatus Baltobacteraceae bacterium]
MLAVCGIAFALLLVEIVTRGSLPWYGNFGWSLAASDRPYVMQVTSVSPSGPAWRGGVRRGDEIDVRDYSFADRSSIVVTPLPNRVLQLQVRRAGSIRTTAVDPVQTPLLWDRWLAFVGASWMLAFAALIAWRRPNLPEARLLSLTLSVFGISNALWFGWFNTAYPIANVAAWVIFGATTSAVQAILARFASLFARPLSPLRRFLALATYAITALSFALYVLTIVAITTLHPDPIALIFGWWSSYFNHVIGIALILPEFLALCCCFLAIAASRGAERQRAAWAVMSLTLLFGSIFVSDIFSDLTTSGETLNRDVLQPLVNLAFFVTPVGLTYALLNRRLLDIGFVVNRAAIFAGVSLIVVGIFILVELAIVGWVTDASRATSTLVNLSVALLLGLSLRFIHRRVEGFVDNVFFRKRHENVVALRRFAREALFITDAQTLLSRTIDEVKRRTETDEVGVLVQGPAGYAFAGAGPALADIDGNDSAILALRTWHESIDLRAYATAVSGEYAFPMVARAKLLGVLVCGRKRNEEAYAPDEREALQTVAQDVGAALDFLSSTPDLQKEILQELRMLPARIKEALQPGGESASRGTRDWV